MSSVIKNRLNSSLRKKTFSLKSLLLIFSCLVLLIFTVTPGLMEYRIRANEGRAFRILYMLITAQGQFKRETLVDQDKDHFGEYGLLEELAGTKSRRGNPQLPPINPSYIKHTLSPKNGASFGSDNGYNFQVYLPGPGGPITDNCFFVSAFIAKQDFIDAQETQLRFYAWPEKFNLSGRKCFAVNQEWRIMRASNEKKQYSGEKKIPSFDAAVNVKKKDNNKLEGEFASHHGFAKDGQKWNETYR